MSVALYRKYRPKLFGEVTNQNHVKITLLNEIVSDKIAHAYLFCGPRGTGKTTLARLLAKSANCLDRRDNGEPCNQCANCLEIMANKSLDIIEIDAASHTGVDNVRDNIINNARFTPAKSKYKVFIIDEVHMLSISAFNALLKIIEEPPAHIIFILATTEAHKVPVTIISRCQRFDFKKIIFKELVERLRWIVGQEGVKVDDEILAAIAKNAGGCVRDAESLLEQVLSVGEKAITYEQAQFVIPRTNHESFLSLFECLVTGNAKAGIELVNALVEDGVDLVLYSNQTVEFLRRVLVYKITNNLAELANDFDDQLISRLVSLLAEVEALRLAEILTIIMTKKEQLKQSQLAQLPLEVAIVEITSRPLMTQKATKPKLPEPPSLDKPKTDALQSSNKAEKTENTVEKNNASAQPIPASAPGKINEQVSLTFNQIVSRWPLILKRVTDGNYSLGMSLSVAKPLALNGQVLTLGFLFGLQKDKVDKPTSLEIIENIMAAEFGLKLNLELMVDASLKLSDITNGEKSKKSEITIEQRETKDPVKQALQAFGGSLVSKI